MTPHHLHALAAAWSLQAARTRLATLAREEARQIRLERLQSADGLRSPAYGQRHASGGHSDPVSGLLLATERPPRHNRWAEMEDRLRLKLRWLAAQVAIPGLPAGSLTRIIVATEHLQPGTAAVVAKHLQDEDRWVRDAVGLAPERQPLPGVACPHCGERQLAVQTAGPVDAWTVICATGRLCTGQGCPCGMPGAVEGVAHIWPRAAVIARAVAGAAPTPPGPNRVIVGEPGREAVYLPNRKDRP